MMNRTMWIALFCGATIITIATGARQSFGLFLRPVILDLNIGREAFGFAMALLVLVSGVAQPVLGAFADRYGAARMVMAGAVLYVGGLLWASIATSAIELHLAFGVLIGLAFGATTFVVILSAVARAVPPQRRSLAFGIVSAFGSFGMFIFMPVTHWLLDAFEWRLALVGLAAIVATVILFAAGIRGDATGERAAGEAQSLGQAMREAGRHSGFWLLTVGYFVCGFHVSFIGTHLPAFLTDSQLPSSAAAWALSLIGFFNILGSIVFGSAGGHYRRKYVLSLLYGVRSCVIALFVLLPVTETSAILFGAAMGFLWLGTVPLTTGLVAQIFGLRYLSMLNGVVFMSHQIGGFLGAWLGGYAFDTFGSYDAIWLIAIGLGIFAVVVHLPIADRPLRAEPAGA
ncbi:MAG: MFS transporter [Alphaproteobacteria bacterium]|nr:MFS transporter [Alphaproteobacteria bacterium]